MARVALLTILAAAVLAPAAQGAVANGGGRGTVDGTKPFSDFGFSVSVENGAVHGHFNCLMAGSSRFPGFTLMAVRGRIKAATITGNAASFDGAGTLLTVVAGKQTKSPATFHVEVTRGGPGVGTLRLTVLTPMVLALPVEHVLVGRISIR
jgi:hypothetical protein